MSSRKIYPVIYDLIGTGESNAVHQSTLVGLTGLSNREITYSIEWLRRNGDIILSSCKGYYKPEDLREVDAYIRRERSRAKNILETIRTAEDYKRQKQNEVTDCV